VRHSLAAAADHQHQCIATTPATLIDDLLDHRRQVRGPLIGTPGPCRRCHLRVMLDSLPDLVIEDIEADLYLAIDRATDRAGRTLVRRIHRQRVTTIGVDMRSKMNSGPTQ
jgi:ribosome-associated translation inhibitor RaiA